MRIISISEALASNVHVGELLDIANWHSDKAAVAIKEGRGKDAQRHIDIEDRLTVRAHQLRAARG